MKKTLSILLALSLVLGLLTVAIAEYDWITLRVETFDREITGLDVTDCWQLHYAQENFGDTNHIKLEFVPFACWTEGDLLTNALAGGTAPDICMTYNGTLVQQCIDDEGIWQLDDLLDTYGADLKAFLGDELLPYGQGDHDGDGTPEQWYIPARRISRANVGNFIRQDWLDALGMEKPTTVDELTAYLRAAKEAGLGGDSTVPFAFSIFESDPLFNVRRKIELEKNVPGGHWVTVNCFQNDSLGGKCLHDIYSPAGLSIIIPLTTDEDTAVAAMKYLDWMAIPENMFAMQNGVEGINYEGLNEDGIPYGVKSADDVPNENKMHAGDICFISNGLCYNDDAKNTAALALPFAGFEEDVVASYADSLSDTWTQISFPSTIQAETDYGATVKSKQGEFLAAVVSCDPAEFDTVFDTAVQETLDSGAAEMIEEFRAAYQAGNFRGTFPGNL